MKYIIRWCLFIMSSILHVAVMSPNRYFCLGLNSLHEQKAMPAIQLHFVTT